MDVLELSTNTHPSLNYIRGGSLRWLKKSSKEVLTREGICMRFWDGSTSNWHKISITCQNSEMAHRFRLETLRWLKIEAIYIWNLFLFEFWAISEFSVWQREPSQSFDMWSRFWANLKLSHLKIPCICLHLIRPLLMTRSPVLGYLLQHADPIGTVNTAQHIPPVGW